VKCVFNSFVEFAFFVTEGSQTTFIIGVSAGQINDERKGCLDISAFLVIFAVVLLNNIFTATETEMGGFDTMLGE